MGDGDDMNKEVKIQLTLSFVLLAFLITTLFFWYPNFVFHTYAKKVDYQYCLSGENSEFMIDGCEFYQKGKIQGYGNARITMIDSQTVRKGDEMLVTLFMAGNQLFSQTIKIESENQFVFLDEKTGNDFFKEKDILNSQLQIKIRRQKEIVYDQTIEMKNQELKTYTAVNKDYTLTNVYATKNWLKTGIISCKDEELAKKYPYMIVDYLYMKDSDKIDQINDYERFIYLNGKTEDFLNGKIEDNGYYDGQGSLFDMKLRCVITLMKSKEDDHPYTFDFLLNPIQKGER